MDEINKINNKITKLNQEIIFLNKYVENLKTEVLNYKLKRNNLSDNLSSQLTSKKYKIKFIVKHINKFSIQPNKYFFYYDYIPEILSSKKYIDFCNNSYSLPTCYPNLDKYTSIENIAYLINNLLYNSSSCHELEHNDFNILITYTYD